MKKQYCPYCMSEITEGEVCRVCGLTAGSYQPNQNHLPPGTVLENRYLIGRVLGEGGFGITYIGCDLKLEMKVAIKEYYPSDKVQRISAVSLEVSVPAAQAESFYEAGKRRFLQEALIMARMDKQPEIVGVRDFFECNHTAYIVMEYVEGTTFKQLVAQRGGGIPAAELLPLVEPLFGALSNLHEKGLIHRDISPDNLMLEHGAVRLLDFGCARQPEHGDATMTIQLKHGYAPIEQYTNHGQGPWTDVYALAATLYYCLVGRTPPQAMDRSLEDELILPRKLGVDLTEEQEKALIKAMNIRRNRRFASMEEFRAALYKAAPELQPVRVRLQVRNILKNSENRGGFTYKLTDSSGSVLKTASTDSQGLTAFSLSFGKETAGYTYQYEIHQMDPGLPDVICSTKVYALTIQIRVRNGRLTAEIQMNGMPVSEEQVFVFHNVLRKTKKWSDWTETLLVIGAALAIITTIILLPMLRDDPKQTDWQPAVGSGLPGMLEETAVRPPVDIDATFANARYFDDGDGWVLGEFLRIHRKQPIVLTGGQYYFDVAAVQKISDPLLIEAGAMMVLEDPVVLDVPLVVRGELQLQSTLTVVGDGQLILEDGCTVVGDGLVLLEDWNNGMVGERTPSMENGIRYVHLNREAFLQQAVHVTTEQELRTVQHTGVLVVDGDITLTEDLDVYYILIVSEGASLTGSLNDENWLSMTKGSKLLNYGTVSCCINSDSGELSTMQNLIYNEGDLQGL